MLTMKSLFPMACKLGVLTLGLSVCASDSANAGTVANGRPGTTRTEAAPALTAPLASPAISAPAKIDASISAPASSAVSLEPSLGGAKVEPVIERYPNGSVKIERQVIQDAAGNYVNHGKYTMFDADGKVLKSGEFRDGRLSGKWTQTFTKDEGHLFSGNGSQEGEFIGPFVSVANFADGQLDGTWTIKDANEKDIIEWNFDHNTRDGKSTWWHANGQKRLEATYKNGSLNGEMIEWDLNGQQTSQNTYIDGRRLVKTVGWYALGQKRFEGNYLQIPNMPEPTYDWWTGSIKSSTPAATGADQKHGVWTEWYLSGTKKGEGQYDHDLPIGKFTYWYENGQKQAEGEYKLGAKSGTWVTWHANGLKESQGEYKEGALGKWMHWESDGRLVEIHEMDKTTHPQVATQPTKGTAQRSDVTSRKR